MSATSTIELVDRFGTRLHVECVDGTDITATVVPKPGSANGGVPSVEIDETDRLKLRDWLASVTS